MKFLYGAAEVCCFLRTDSGHSDPALRKALQDSPQEHAMRIDDGV
jgi:hypothetical protein